MIGYANLNELTFVKDKIYEFNEPSNINDFLFFDMPLNLLNYPFLTINYVKIEIIGEVKIPSNNYLYTNKIK